MNTKARCDKCISTKMKMKDCLFQGFCWKYILFYLNNAEGYIRRSSLLLRCHPNSSKHLALGSILQRHQLPQHPSTSLQPPPRHSPFPPSPRCPRHSQGALPGWQHKSGSTWPRGLREARRVPGAAGWSWSPVHLQGASGHPKLRG